MTVRFVRVILAIIVKYMLTEYVLRYQRDTFEETDCAL